MGNSWHFVVDGERVEIRAHESCGLFLLSALPRDWRELFMSVDVRDAILAELTAREDASPAPRPTDAGCTAEAIPMSWYSVRARLLPAAQDPVADAAAIPPRMAVARMTLPA